MFKINGARMRRRVAASAGALVLATFGLVGAGGLTSSASAAAGCYDSGSTFTKKAGISTVPTGDGWWKTTANCQDINVKIYPHVAVDGANLRVCFRTAGCQDHYTFVHDNNFWNAIATDVRDGTEYRLQFTSKYTSYNISGHRAG